MQPSPQKRLTEAVQRSRVVEISYRGLWRPDAYTTPVDPYGLVLHEGDLFLVGRSHRAQAVRVFKVTRIDTVTPLADEFKRPADFSLEDHFCNTFGIVRTGGQLVEVVVRFTGPAAALVEERVWHESQHVEWLASEQALFEELESDRQTLQATFRLTDLVEFKRWIKGFGADAEIIRPESLRRELRDELHATLHRYDSDSDAD